MDGLLDYAPIAATAFAIPQFLPQILKLRRTDDTAGVSWPWATLTSVNNAAWFGYFALSGYWAALVPSSSATLLAGALAAMLALRGRAKARPAVLVGAWVALLTAAFTAAGRTGLGTLLTAAFVLQVTPSIWTAYRTDRPTGISQGTWLLILGELSCWATFGVHQSDPRLLILGFTGVAASLLMLARVWRARTAVRRRATIVEGPRLLVELGSGLAWASSGHPGLAAGPSRQDPAKQVDPGRPARRAGDRAGQHELGAVEEVVDERVVQGLPDERPGQHHAAMAVALQDVAELDQTLTMVDLQPVGALEAEPGREPEHDPPPWQVLLDVVGDGAVAAGRAHGERPVKAQRWPAVGGPEPVVGAGEPVEQGPGPLGAGRQVALVDVEDRHCRHLHTLEYGETIR
jgi:hypothetical protein